MNCARKWDGIFTRKRLQYISPSSGCRFEKYFISGKKIFKDKPDVWETTLVELFQGINSMEPSLNESKQIKEYL